MIGVICCPWLPLTLGVRSLVGPSVKFWTNVFGHTGRSCSSETKGRVAESKQMATENNLSNADHFLHSNFVIVTALWICIWVMRLMPLLKFASNLDPWSIPAIKIPDCCQLHLIYSFALALN
jgi:hypothetical protein